ncbi:MAG: family 43 glycosylhydrolase [Ignavibacteriaceae bacterium]
MKKFKSINIFSSKIFIYTFFILNIMLAECLAQVSKIDSTDMQILKQIASLRNELIQARMKRFEHLTIANQNKAAGIIEELLNRAEQKIWNTLPPGRYDWSWAGFDKPNDMVSQAEGFLKILSIGKDPFKGKFAEPGGYVVDHAFIEKDGVTHLFYIRGVAATSWPEYPLFNFGHAVSKDLIHWQIEKPVLQCPDSGWDDYQVWAPYVIKYNNQYWMFYAGVNKNVCQAIGLATSKDLYHWKRYNKNPIITTGHWGLWNPNQWTDCRDPMVLQDGDTFYCYYTAGRTNPETLKHEYCVGISSSKDLLTWKDEGFIRLKNSLETPPESPFVLKHNGIYYIIYTNYKYGIVYATSHHPVKDWHELPIDKMIILSGPATKVSASEIYHINNKWYISLISHMKNGLSFLEIRKFIWNKDGTISVGDFIK